MSTHPRIEARISTQERRQTYLEVRIEELSEDTKASFKELSEGIDARYKQISAYFGTLEEDIGKVKTDITDMKTDITDVKTRLGRLETLLIQVLERLPKVP